MSSLGSQWRMLRQIRHYLSMTTLNAEVEKLVQKLKPASPDQWESLIKKFEQAISARMSQNFKEFEPIRNRDSKLLHSTTVHATTVQENKVDDKIKVQEEKHEKANEQPKVQESLTVAAEEKEMTIQGLLQGLRLKKDLHFGKLSEQQSWRTHKPVVTKSSIHSRTAYVISAIVTAETTECLQNRTEHFIEHLRQYPEARDYAIKEGGVRALLRVQKRLEGDNDVVKQVDGIVNEALALMGYVKPTKGPGPNILSIDGGGIRGLIAIEILRHLERLTGRKVHEMFDYIIGVSTGAIIAAVIGSGVGNLETANEMYLTLSKKMFGNTSLIGGTSRLVWTHSYYDTDAWEALLKENLGDMTMTQCNRRDTPKLALVSCIVNAGSRLSPYVFRSYECGFRVRSVFPGGSRAAVWQAVRASAAAPTYFNEFTLDDLLHQDGGIMVNNPTGVGIHEAKLLFGPNSVRNGCVISVGTGKALNKHLDYQLLSKGIGTREQSGTSWKDKFNKILDSATDTEGTHLMLNDLLPPGSYYRFNPPLMEECAMDEIDPVKLNNLVIDTSAYIRRNQHKFEQAAAMLVRKRSAAQKILDYVQYQSQVMGVAPTN